MSAEGYAKLFTKCLSKMTVGESSTVYSIPGARRHIIRGLELICRDMNVPFESHFENNTFSIEGKTLVIFGNYPVKGVGGDVVYFQE